MTHLTWRLGLLLVSVGAAGGCGPMLSMTEITGAEDAIERAYAVSADELAVFEFVSAESYLAKAREEWGRSDFQHAISYAERAAAFADSAAERALRTPRSPGTPVQGSPYATPATLPAAAPVTP